MILSLVLGVMAGLDGVSICQNPINFWAPPLNPAHAAGCRSSSGRLWLVTKSSDAWFQTETYCTCRGKQTSLWTQVFSQPGYFLSRCGNYHHDFKYQKTVQTYLDKEIKCSVAEAEFNLHDHYRISAMTLCERQLKNSYWKYSYLQTDKNN